MIEVSKYSKPKCLIEKNELHLKLDLQALLKSDQLLWDGKKFNSLSKDPSIDGLTPMVHIFPENQQEIESIIELANNYNTRVWLNSSDEKRGYLNIIESKKTIVLHSNRMNLFQNIPQKNTLIVCTALLNF